MKLHNLQMLFSFIKYSSTLMCGVGMGIGYVMGNPKDIIFCGIVGLTWIFSFPIIYGSYYIDKKHVEWEIREREKKFKKDRDEQMNTNGDK